VTGVGAPFRFDRTWGFPVPPDGLWAVLRRTDRYPEWWSWLRELDTDGFETGATANCVIQSPLPYALRCAIHVDEMRPPATIVPSSSAHSTFAPCVCSRRRQRSTSVR